VHSSIVFDGDPGVDREGLCGTARRLRAASGPEMTDAPANFPALPWVDLVAVMLAGARNELFENSGSSGGGGGGGGGGHGGVGGSGGKTKIKQLGNEKPKLAVVAKPDPTPKKKKRQRNEHRHHVVGNPEPQTIHPEP